MLPSLCIGVLPKAQYPPATAPVNQSAFSSTISSSNSQSLVASKQQYRVADTVRISPDTYHIGLMPVAAATSGDNALSISVTPPPIVIKPGQHVRVTATGLDMERSYTPVDVDASTGRLDLVVKSYAERKGLSAHLGKAVVGDVVSVSGPHGKFDFAGTISVGRVTHLVCFSAGSGITPIYQVIKAIVDAGLKRPSQITLFYSNKTDADILLQPEFEELLKKRGTNLTIVNYLTRQSKPLSGDGTDPTSSSTPLSSLSSSSSSSSEAKESPRPEPHAKVVSSVQRVYGSRMTKESVEVKLPIAITSNAPGADSAYMEHAMALVCGPPEFNAGMETMLEAWDFGKSKKKSSYFF